VEKFAPHVERLNAVAVSMSRRFVAVAGFRDVDPVLSARPPSQVHVVSHPDGTPHSSYDAGGDVASLVFLADDLLVVGTVGGELIAWDVGAGERQPILRTRAHEGAVAALAADATGTTLASVGDDGILRIAPLVVSSASATLEAVAQRKLSSRPLRALAIDSRASVVVLGGDDGVVRSVPLVNTDSGDVREMPCGEGGVAALTFTGDGRVVVGCGDGSIRVSFLEGAIDEENRSGEAAHTAPVRGLTFGPEIHDEADRLLPRRLFSIAEDGVLKAWQMDSHRKPRTVELGAGELTAMAHVAAPDGAKSERRGGQLVVVSRARQIVRVTVNEKSEPSESVERVQSELERLAQALGARKDEVRVTALEALAALPEDEARQLLEQALAGDRQADIRKLAAERIGTTSRRLSRPALRAALDDKEEAVRNAALDALTTIESAAPLSPVRAALRSSHADMRATAVARLPELRGTSPLVPGLVADALGDADAAVRTAALDALHALAPEGSFEPARVALDRGPADIRSAALLRLARAGLTLAPEGRGMLAAAQDDAEQSVRSTAFLVAVASRGELAAAVRRVDEHTAGALDVLEKDGRFAAEVEPGQLNDDDLHPLFAAMACRSADTALRGARLLALLGDGRAIGVLLGLSREADVEVRRFVVEGLGAAARAMPGDDRVTSRLEWLLDDEDGTVREWSFDTLLAFAEPVGAAAKLDFVAMALRCAHEDVRARTLQILVALGGPDAEDEDSGARADRLLGDALDDEAAKVRGEAFRTLWAWHGKTPRIPLERGSTSRHADIRKKVVEELTRIEEDWARELILSLVADGSAEVGFAAYQALTKTFEDKKVPAVHLVAMSSPRPEVRAEGAKGAQFTSAADVRERLVELVEDEHPIVHLAAIAAVDALVPDDRVAFEVAFASIFYELRVAAAAHCARRRDNRGVDPMKELLTIPKTHMNRPSDDVRQRAARALAAVGDFESVRFYVSMLDDEDGVVQEMGARGLASACRPGEEQPLLDGMAHENLAVRSWVAEGLARLGDDRAVPVLAGTLRHEHRPIRLGAVLSFVALGPDGVRGILQGLEDSDRAIQDLVLAVVVARDVALARAQLPPDLLLSALCAASPEIRFAAARAVEGRSAGEELSGVATELVGPHKPDKAADMKDWPADEERQALLNVTVNALASDRPSLRYAAANVLWLRAQPVSFWREAKRLGTLVPASTPVSPHTDWSDEPRQPRQRGWIRRLFSRPAVARGDADSDKVLTFVERVGSSGASADEIDSDDLARLAFGTYAGLVRQAPA